MSGAQSKLQTPQSPLLRYEMGWPNLSSNLYSWTLIGIYNVRRTFLFLNLSLLRKLFEHFENGKCQIFLQTQKLSQHFHKKNFLITCTIPTCQLVTIYNGLICSEVRNKKRKEISTTGWICFTSMLYHHRLLLTPL